MPNLKEIDASNNLITSIHKEMQDMYCIETLRLFGNPIVNTASYLAQIENNQDALMKALEQYFGGAGSQGIGGLSSFPSMSIGAPPN